MCSRVGPKNKLQELNKPYNDRKQNYDKWNHSVHFENSALMNEMLDHLASSETTRACCKSRFS